MKSILRILAFGLMVGCAYAQSNLPACQGSNSARWSNCLGTFTFPGGDKNVSEYQNGTRFGQGIEYDKNGFILRSGTWKNDQLVSPHALDKSRFPFESQALTVVINNQSANFNVGTALSQSNLPDCQGSNSARWSNCLGTFTFPGGDRIVSEYQNGMRNGKGIEYDKTGSVLRSGTWKNGVWTDAKLVLSEQAQQAGDSNSELARLRAEADESKRKQAELEEKLKLAQQQPISSQVGSSLIIGKRVALVVGNANYKVRPLKNSRNDADDISRSLKATGFEVIDLRDATLPQMRSAVRQFGDRLVNNDVGLVYYSGHGVEVKGRNYFIPVNADIQREDEIADQGLDVSLILEKMSTAGKGVNILIVDACRDDPFGRSFRSSSRGLAQMDAPRGTIIAYATSPGKVASDGDPRERNSPYTKHLVKAMQSPNKPIEQVFKEVRRAVQDETKNQQTPWENTSLSGDFFFRVQK
jgi:hypothetical protein